jgi:Flp pilus assembly pilin Flp
MKHFAGQQFLLQEKEHRAQALIEYVLILASVSVFAVMGLKIAGEAIKEQFYVAAAAAELDVQSSGFKVLCVTGERPKANIPSHPDNITRVEFYVNGVLYSTDTTAPKYCMNGENGQQCAKYDIASGATVKMVAYDSEGHTGQCSRTLP